MNIHSYTFRASYYETDCMCIVHHSNYIRFFEDARIRFMYDIGCDVREIEKSGIVIPNTEAYAKYIKPLKFFDEFRVDVKLTKFNGASFKFEYQLFTTENNILSANGFTSHCFATADELKPLSIKHKLPDIYEKMKNSVTNE